MTVNIDKTIICHEGHGVLMNKTTAVSQGAYEHFWLARTWQSTLIQRCPGLEDQSINQKLLLEALTTTILVEPLMREQAFILQCCSHNSWKRVRR